jgi:hypothetical protein
MWIFVAPMQTHATSIASTCSLQHKHLQLQWKQTKVYEDALPTQTPIAIMKIKNIHHVMGFGTFNITNGEGKEVDVVRTHLNFKCRLQIECINLARKLLQ